MTAIAQDIMLTKILLPMLNKRQKIPKGQSKMDNPETLAIQGTQDEENQSKNTTKHNMCQTPLCANKHK